MIGSDILLFPDTGPDFLRCLRTAALYAERVSVLTLLHFDFADRLCAECDESRQQELTSVFGLDSRCMFFVNRFVEYFRFVKETKQDLKMLNEEGILRSLITERQPIPIDSQFTLLFGLPWDEKATTRLGAAWFQELNQQRLFDSAAKILQLCPPSHFDLDALGSICSFGDEHPECQDLIATKPWLFLIPLTMFYLATLAVYAEDAGSGFLCWSKKLQEAVWTFRESLAASEAEFVEPLHRRKAAEAQLGHVVLERYIPSAENYSFEKILKLRSSRAPELEAFRVSIAELATQIDVESPSKSIELQINDLTRSKIDPAIRDLNSALYSSRMESLTKFSKSWKSAAPGVISAVLSFAVGAPLSVSAIVAAGGIVGIPILEGVIERKKLRRASQWSFLLRLSELS